VAADHKPAKCLAGTGTKWLAARCDAASKGPSRHMLFSPDHHVRPGQRVVVAIPARDEADWIARCLGALARQTRPPHEVLLLANNCTDRTSSIARVLAAHMPFRLHVPAVTLPPAAANAGHARQMAMQSAAALAGPDGILLTTDADTVVAPDWIERNLLALAAGADVVCGRVALDAADAARIPAHLHADDALEGALIELLDRIACSLDPDPADPWPRHTEAAGASIAVTAAAFRQAGGIPPVASGEDRAFVQVLARMDAAIRHDPTIIVTVSGRIHGRAPGGMADTIRRRMQQQDEFADAAVEPAVDAYRRSDFRRRAREAWQRQPTAVDLAADLGIPLPRLRTLLNHRWFGTAWAAIELHSPVLVRRRVRFADLPRQIAYARDLLEPQPITDAACP